MMEIRLRLDDEVDRTVIAEIKKVAGGGAVSKALYCIVLEWYFLKQRCFVTDPGRFTADLGESAADLGQNENSLTEVLSNIDQEW